MWGYQVLENRVTVCKPAAMQYIQARQAAHISRCPFTPGSEMLGDVGQLGESDRCFLSWKLTLHCWSGDWGKGYLRVEQVQQTASADVVLLHRVYQLMHSRQDHLHQQE